MKKLLILCAFAAFFVSCDTEEGADTPQNPQEAAYLGTLTVTDHTKNPATSVTTQNVNYALSKGEDGLLSLTMSEIRFAAEMPMGLTITIPKLKLDNTTLTSTQDPIIAQMGDKDRPEFGIEQFSGRLTTNNQLEITFTCVADNPLGPNRPLQLNHTAVYKGTITK